MTATCALDASSAYACSCSDCVVLAEHRDWLFASLLFATAVQLKSRY